LAPSIEHQILEIDKVKTKTLDTMIDFFSIDANWDNLDYEFKKTHPLILVKVRNILFTSLMLVFQKVVEHNLEFKKLFNRSNICFDEWQKLSYLNYSTRV
jgi:hypothetical protein